MTEPYEPLRQAAAVLRGGAALSSELREAIAVWLEAEAVIVGERQPFVDLINAQVEHKTGVKTWLSFGRTEAGEPHMEFDSSEAAFAVAHLLLAS